MADTSIERGMYYLVVINKRNMNKNPTTYTNFLILKGNIIVEEERTEERPSLRFSDIGASLAGSSGHKQRWRRRISGDHLVVSFRRRVSRRELRSCVTLSMLIHLYLFRGSEFREGAPPFSSNQSEVN